MYVLIRYAASRLNIKEETLMKLKPDVILIQDIGDGLEVGDVY
jgi:hypothetical protein